MAHVPSAEIAMESAQLLSGLRDSEAKIPRARDGDKTCRVPETMRDENPRDAGFADGPDTIDLAPRPSAGIGSQIERLARGANPRIPIGPVVQSSTSEVREKG